MAAGKADSLLDEDRVHLRVPNFIAERLHPLTVLLLGVHLGDEHGDEVGYLLLEVVALAVFPQVGLHLFEDEAVLS